MRGSGLGLVERPWVSRAREEFRSGGIVRLCSLFLFHPYRRYRYWAAQRALRARDRKWVLANLAFDEKYGVDTAGFIAPADLNVPDEHLSSSFAYEAAQEEHILAAIGAVRDPLNRFTFVDYGSGKGKALLLASLFPFESIVGVELSDGLCTVARHNVDIFSDPGQVCEDVDVVHMDALTFPVPDDPLVLYFCNPFDRSIMARVAERVEASLIQNPRPIWVIYINARFREVFDRASWLVNVVSDDLYRVYGPSGTFPTSAGSGTES